MTIAEQLADVRTKIRKARFINNLAALAVLEPRMDELLDQLPRMGRT